MSLTVIQQHLTHHLWWPWHTPPWVPMSMYHQHGSIWSNSNSQAMGSQASGYSSHHAHYGSECKRWAKLSYAIPAAQTISLEISLFMRAGSGERVVVALPLGYVFYLQNCGLVINDISLEHLWGPKGYQCSYQCTWTYNNCTWYHPAKDLDFCSDFVWYDNEFVVQDGKWVDLSTHQARQPYFLNQCWQASHKALKPVIFKSKQFSLMVVAPQTHWL